VTRACHQPFSNRGSAGSVPIPEKAVENYYQPGQLDELSQSFNQGWPRVPIPNARMRCDEASDLKLPAEQRLRPSAIRREGLIVTRNQCHRTQTPPCHRAHLRTSRRVWRMVVLATQTPLTRVLPGPHAKRTCVIMPSG
jgi:hypothetical protein